MSNNLLDHFSSLKDPRIERKKLHQLPDIIFLAITATISLADGWKVIAEFGQKEIGMVAAICSPGQRRTLA